MPRWYLFAAMVLVGCAATQPLSGRGTLIVKPQVLSGGHTQTLLPNYTKDSITTLKLALFTVKDGTETALGIERTLPNAQISNPVSFSNLKAQTTYRIKAYAYDAGSALISQDASSSWTDVVLLSDDHPTLSTLKVQLIDRAFSGTGSSSLAITPGGYAVGDPESLKVLGVEGIVSTLAGNGTATYSIGVGTEAAFNWPSGVTCDAQGYVYVADRYNNYIRKIAADGTVTNYAGNGASGFQNGASNDAMFRYPIGIAFDRDGNLYVADHENHMIRKIDSLGAVSTLAGNGATGWVDGTGTLAQFNKPSGVTCDAQGNVYVVEYENSCLRKITPQGVVSTLAGCGATGFAEGTGTLAKFARPEGVVADAQGNLYVGDRYNNRIRKVTPGGVVSTFVGSGVAGYRDGLGTTAQLNHPEGLVFDPYGNLYFVDRVNQRIRKASASGWVSTVAGNGATAYADGTGINASFREPFGIAIDPSGNLYVGDIKNHRVRMIR